MKRILAISDIHGSYDKFIELLEIAKYDSSEDKLIIIGDYCDRGQKSKEVIEKCISLKEESAITLMGNHDRMFTNWLLTDSYHHAAMFLQNGGLQTIESYLGREWANDGLTHENYQVAKKFIKDHYPHHIDFLLNNNIYHEHNNHVFVHAGVKPYYKDWKSSTENDYLWIREEFILNKHEYKETFVVGHTPCKLIHDSNDIVFGNKKIMIDGGCFFSGQLNCLEIKDGGFYKQYNT